MAYRRANARATALSSNARSENVTVNASSADPARAYFASVSKAAEGRPEVGDFFYWLKQEAKG